MSTILIAYEREMEQNAVEKLLAERGHAVIRANNGVDALEAARRESPSLIISDISLPKMDGFSLCKKWKQDEHLRSVPFMFYTKRHEDPKYERFALELGVDRFVERTNDNSAFFSALDSVLADGAVARKADTMRLKALSTGAFLTTGKHMSTQSQLATTIVATNAQRVNGSDGNGVGSAASTEERALAREARLLARIAELDSQNKHLQTGEQKLRESLDTQMRAATHIAETYSAIQVAAADGFWLLDDKDQLRDVNEAYCRLSGYNKDELLKLKASDLDTRWRDDAATHSEVLREEGQIRYQTQHKRKDGSLCDVELSIGALTGAHTRRVVIIRDITARSRRTESAKRMERAKDAALEIFAGAESWDDAALMRRATELAAAITESPLAYFCTIDTAKNSAALMTVFESGDRFATLVSADQRTLPTGPWNECARSGKPLLLEEMGTYEKPTALPPQRNAVLIPASAGTDSAIVIVIANRSSTTYSEVDCTTLAPLVNACGATLRAKNAHVQSLITSQRADVALQGAIEAFARMAERHDQHSAGIARRVAALAVAIARELNLSRQEQNIVRTAALLHRVGTIAIPLVLLNKPSELTPVELAFVRTHVEESYKLLSDVEFGAPVAEIVRQHCERLDGSGYPRGLRNEQICTEARILAVAEHVVTAMSKQTPFDVVLKELEAGADRLFDVKVVQACVRLFKENGFVLPA